MSGHTEKNINSNYPKFSLFYIHELIWAIKLLFRFSKTIDRQLKLQLADNYFNIIIPNFHKGAKMPPLWLRH